MKKIPFILLLFFSFALSQAQTATYSHDAHGNRNIRKISIDPNPNPSLSSVGGRSMNTIDSTMNKEITMKLAMQYGISVFPSPTESEVEVVANEVPNNTSYIIYVTDAAGKLVYKETKYQQKYTLPLANNKPGIYYVRILIGNKDELSYKVIKH
jgi:Secretion system C-terminal sorting domain